MSKIFKLKSAMFFLISFCINSNCCLYSLAQMPELQKSARHERLTEKIKAVPFENIELKMKDMEKDSESVLIAEARFIDGSVSDKFKSVRFDVRDILKGGRIGASFYVKCTSNIPEQHSLWILFIKELVPVEGYIININNDEGRLQATEENRKLIYGIFKKNPPNIEKTIRKLQHSSRSYK